MRIALLIDPLTVRTRPGDHSHELCRTLRARGHEVRAFGAPPGQLPDEAASERVHTLSAFAPQALLAYDALSPSAYAGARAARRLRAGLVLVEPGLDAHRLGFSRRVLLSIGERFWGSYVRSTARNILALDPVGEAMARAKGFASDRITLCPEGVDTHTFRPGLSSTLLAAHRIRGRVMLYTGPLELSRDLGTLVSAFAATIGQRNDWHLVLAGEGEARATLRAQAERSGLGDRVHFLQRPSLDVLPGLISSATVLVQPGLGAEVRGRQVARAMACGIPAVAAELPRLKHLLEHERTGLWAKSADLPSWTSALARMAASPQLRMRCGEAARAQAVERLDWSAIGADLERLLESACTRARAA
ncbi:MAG: glycosyltransferase [Planctomycetes bacterium]|nr:glycosyltransferase [Planctomycetota bacterium]